MSKVLDFMFLLIVIFTVVAILSVLVSFVDFKHNVEIKCYSSGWPTAIVSSVDGDFVGYCGRVVNGTDVMIPLEDVYCVLDGQ